MTAVLLDNLLALALALAGGYTLLLVRFLVRREPERLYAAWGLLTILASWGAIALIYARPQ